MLTVFLPGEKNPNSCILKPEDIFLQSWPTGLLGEKVTFLLRMSLPGCKHILSFLTLPHTKRSLRFLGSVRAALAMSHMNYKPLLCALLCLKMVCVCAAFVCCSCVC